MVYLQADARADGKADPEAASTDECETQLMNTPEHVAVIGGGIIGGSVAFHLAKRGVRVTVIEADQPGQGASRVSYAWINGRDKNPFGYHELNRRSQDMWRRFVDDLRADVDALARQRHAAASTS